MQIGDLHIYIIAIDRKEDMYYGKNSIYRIRGTRNAWNRTRVAYRLCTGKEFPVRRVGRTILIPIKSFNDWLYCDKKEEFVSDQAVTDTNKVAS